MSTSKPMSELRAELKYIAERLRVNVPVGITSSSTMAEVTKAISEADDYGRALIKRRTAIRAIMRKRHEEP